MTLNLNGHLSARGVVTAVDGFAACEDGVPVKIQKQGQGGGWHTIRMTSTRVDGDYHIGIPDNPGHYRALAPKGGTESDVCKKDRSPRRRHRH